MAWQLKHRLVCLHERRLCILVRILYLGDVAERARISSPRIFLGCFRALKKIFRSGIRRKIQAKRLDQLVQKP